MILFYRDCINVFTDTSDRTLTTARGVFKATCCGFVATYQGRMMESGIETWIDEPTIFGEAKGVEMALNWILYAASRGLRPPTAYNIFTDNHAVVARINNYLIDWFSNYNQGQRLALVYSGKTNGIGWENVAYNIAYSIFTSNLPIRVFYTPGHIPVYNVPFKGFKTANQKFLELNEKYHGDLERDLKSYITYEMATFNNVVDLMTRNYLFQNIYLIEADIDHAGSNIALGEDKILPLRWPFRLSNVPNYVSEGAAATLMITAPTK